MNKVSPLFPNFNTATITIASDTKLSNKVDLSNQILVGIIVPSTFDGTTLTLNTSSAIGGTYVPVQAAIGANTVYTITTTASQYVPLDKAITQGLQFVQLACTSDQTSTNTIFTLVTIPRT